MNSIQESKIPKYWKYETTGKLREIIIKFLHNMALEHKDLWSLKYYIIQWIDAMPLKPRGWECFIKNASQNSLFEYVMELNKEWGINPF